MISASLQQYSRRRGRVSSLCQNGRREICFLISRRFFFIRRLTSYLVLFPFTLGFRVFTFFDISPLPGGQFLFLYFYYSLVLTFYGLPF